MTDGIRGSLVEAAGILLITFSPPVPMAYSVLTHFPLKSEDGSRGCYSLSDRQVEKGCDNRGERGSQNMLDWSPSPLIIGAVPHNLVTLPPGNLGPGVEFLVMKLG